MTLRTIYAHWLDPEYTSFRWPPDFVRRRLGHIEDVLKLHAILGDTIYVTDPQFTDSRAFLELFCDSDFRRFAEANPDFLRLVARPTDALGATDQTLQVIESALERTLRPYWKSSTFKEVAVPRAVAEWVRGQRPRDPESFCEALTKFEVPAKLAFNEARLVGGMKAALRYFATPGSHVFPPKEPVPPPTLYDDVLQEAECNPDLKRFKNELGSTLQFVNTADKGKTHARTPAVSALEEAGLDNPVNYMHLAHIIQAWNLAVARTVRAGRQDVPLFRRAVPISAIYGSVTEVTAPCVRTTIEDDELFESFNHTWHPADLSWGQIANIRDNGECSKAISKLQRVSSAELLKPVLESVGKVIAKEGTSVPSLLVSSEVGLAKAIFGPLRRGVRVSRRMESLPAAVRLSIKLAEVALLPVGIADLLLECAEWELRRREGTKISEILESYAVRYNLIG